MKGTALAEKIVIGALMTLVLTSVGAAYAESVTYSGVTFPNGDVAFADRVVDYLAASCVRDAYDDPEEALGPPDASCAPGCVGCDGCDTNAVSLGFRLSELDVRGYLIVQFVDNALTDGTGDDLFIYITNGKPAIVEISADGINYINVGQTVGYPGTIDIGPYATSGQLYRFVRLSDVPADEDHSACPGPSIDAIGAMGPEQESGALIGEVFGSLELQPIGQLAIALGTAPDSILIILDASSSMEETVDGQVKIDVAKEVLVDLVEDLPVGALVGMRVFSGCSNIYLLSPIAPLDRAWLTGEILAIEPRGATPIADALILARQDLSSVAGEKLILLITDGMETCKGDPVVAAQDLITSGYDLRINVVGFDVSRNETARDQLMQIAEATGGLYFDADSSEELRTAISLSAPFSYTVYDENGIEVFSGRLGGDAPELAVGTYRVVIATDPVIVIEDVVVEEQKTTTITVEAANGSYEAEVAD